MQVGFKPDFRRRALPSLHLPSPPMEQAAQISLPVPVDTRRRFCYNWRISIHQQRHEWTAGDSGLMNANVYALAVIGNNLFAGTMFGVFLSTNNGTNWTAVDSGLTKTYVLVLLPFLARISLPELIAAGCFSSTNNGGSWILRLILA